MEFLQTLRCLRQILAGSRSSRRGPIFSLASEIPSPSFRRISSVPVSVVTSPHDNTNTIHTRATPTTTTSLRPPLDDDTNNIATEDYTKRVQSTCLASTSTCTHLYENTDHNATTIYSQQIQLILVLLIISTNRMHFVILPSLSDNAPLC